MAKKTHTLHNGNNGERVIDEAAAATASAGENLAVADGPPIAVRRVQAPTQGPPPHVMQRILKCLTAVQKGTFSVRLPGDWTGLEGKVADSINEIIATNERMARELKRVSRMVGKQ